MTARRPALLSVPLFLSLSLFSLYARITTRPRLDWVAAPVTASAIDRRRAARLGTGGAAVGAWCGAVLVLWMLYTTTHVEGLCARWRAITRCHKAPNPRDKHFPVFGIVQKRSLLGNYHLRQRWTWPGSIRESDWVGWKRFNIFNYKFSLEIVSMIVQDWRANTGSMQAQCECYDRGLTMNRLWSERYGVYIILAICMRFVWQCEFVVISALSWQYNLYSVGWKLNQLVSNRDLNFEIVFTALHIMQTRYSEENSVCPSVCPSVTRVDCDKTVERSVQIYTPYERTFILVFWEEEWLVGGDPFYLKFWVNWHPLERNRRFSTNNRS